MHAVHVVRHLVRTIYPDIHKHMLCRQHKSFRELERWCKDV